MNTNVEKLTFLGTGAALVTHCYNSCFVVSNNESNFLVDAGGGNQILAQLEKASIDINSIHDVFITHNHSDHILGMVWVVRAVSQLMLKDKYIGNLNIYAHQKSVDALRQICSLVLQKKLTNLFDQRIVFTPISDGFTTTILDWPITFFDIRSTKELQHAFSMTLNSGKMFTFLGDEPLDSNNDKYVKDVDILLQESYCLYADRERFKPYEKHHATVKDACINAHQLGVKKTILFHTEDSDMSSRKLRYITEGKTFYDGEIIIPDDLETIYL